MNQPEFDVESAKKAVDALTQVLQRRTHKKEFMGQTYLIRGTLAHALHLPDIQKRLNSSVRSQQEKGLNTFSEIWPTLSAKTQQATLETMGWYDPKDLDWDDPRSNRQPRLPTE